MQDELVEEVQVLLPDRLVEVEPVRDDLDSAGVAALPAASRAGSTGIR